MVLPRILALVVLLLAGNGLLSAGETALSASADDVVARMQQMDRDGDGMATVSEISEFLRTLPGERHGTASLDDWEAVAMGRRCSSPFSGFTANGGP
jgi:hypothetical protein